MWKVPWVVFSHAHLCPTPSVPLLPATLVGGGKPHCEGSASSLSHASPHLHLGLFTDPHYFQSPSLVKSNLVTRYQLGKTFLARWPLRGARLFSNFYPSRSVQALSLWAGPSSN